jgi:hypothetical protein
VVVEPSRPFAGGRDAGPDADAGFGRLCRGVGDWTRVGMVVGCIKVGFVVRIIESRSQILFALQRTWQSSVFRKVTATLTSNNTPAIFAPRW